MRRKLVGYMLSMLTVILALFMLGSTAHAKEISVTGLTAGNAIVLDANGKPVTDTSTLNDKAGYQLTYHWSIPDSEVIKAGDTATVEIPTYVSIDHDVVMPLTDSAGQTLGTFTYTKGASTGTITFTDALGTLNSRAGTLSMNAKGNATATEGSAEIAKSGLVVSSGSDGAPTVLGWHITVTPGNNSTVVVTDTLGPNQTFIPDSVAAQAVQIINGIQVPQQPLTPTVATNGNVITFTFNNIHSPFVITYNTKVENFNPADTAKWHNTAALDGLGVDATADITYGGNGTAGMTYTIELTKHDAATKAVLAGAVYELQDSTGKVIQTGLTTDSQGQLIVKNLRAGDYQFVETKAPFGYELNTTPVKFTLGGIKPEVAFQVSQDDVTLTKTDATTKAALAGAVYELQDATGKVLKMGLTTDTTGQLTVSGLTAGNYQFVETKAPSGYQLNAAPLSFTIKPNQTAVVTVAATDEPVTEPGTTEPGKPGEPGTTEPSQPGEPGTTEPSKPGEPGTTEPSKPGEPGTTEPSQPGEPGTTEPSKPGEPGTTEPSQPGKPGEPGTTEPGNPGTTGPTAPQPERPAVPGPSQPAAPKPGQSGLGQPALPGLIKQPSTGVNGAGGTVGNGVTTGMNGFGTPTGSDQSTSAGYNHGTLPQTSEKQSPIWVIFAGLLGLLIAAVGIGYRRRA
ncbi:SpaA isopeptide-forming pilin-related protein [Lactiplantibacillus plantarum]|uniref:SpaA isopeptide-forming pilin-related protein n=1 Tax=Lactiplantibacillus plantarum TaxID=1590 RepID=UPI001AAEDDBB|nr:SpaA isopeptide-forming pilin-related protein [Lactiplantibacillus plantarum]MBO2720774.1 LPXTG cell wall anchor domain-containing protein [Lactiplantibacillus plantarum]MBU7445484.1 LPXTG cell wall anchor domain-containing protein [Lactiplantibacillus plantarum]MBU7456951.1 LPXTG cell wall anchor domain-containing protein [Lactiplantibacillus plantarum]MEA5156732.1 SpaA isopeptide-forming pilin-related protein [Lactiplantibacillus plantarum]